MHYYQFNIADYRKDTTHLSPLEHYIYRQLIDWYFLDEKPINKDLNIVLRRINLNVLDCEHLLENVLIDFFTEKEDGFHHKRIDAELNEYKEYLDKQSRNGKKGGRPPKIKTQNNPPLNLANPNLTQKKPNQEPLTTNHKPLTKDQEILSENSSEIPTPSKQIKIPYQEIVSLYHNEMPLHPRIEKLDSTRKSYIKRLWLDIDDIGLPDIDHWLNFFSFIKQSQFLTGQVHGHDRKPFIPNLEWLTKPKNYLKISEGHYHG